MAVETAFAEAGKNVCRIPGRHKHEGRLETPAHKKLFPWIGGDGTGTHHLARGCEGEVEDGSEIDLESKDAAVFPNDLTMLTKKFAIAVANTSAGEGVGPSTSRKRSTLPPSRSTQVKRGVETYF